MFANSIYFIGTGRPVSPSTNPRLDREASRKGIAFSGVSNIREFHEQIVQKLTVPPTEIGRNAANIPRTMTSGIDIMA